MGSGRRAPGIVSADLARGASLFAKGGQAARLGDHDRAAAGDRSRAAAGQLSPGETTLRGRDQTATANDRAQQNGERSGAKRPPAFSRPANGKSAGSPTRSRRAGVFPRPQPARDRRDDEYAPGDGEDAAPAWSAEADAMHPAAAK